jgi:7,8-dihydropterin-6-yl-methyl-4-(beta-D-ribofuranosyl)aminobenzene 5'-phosphate synthase
MLGLRAKDHGCFIEEEDKRILFDTGYSDIFIKNAGKMDIDLRVLDYVVLSHGHSDHTWGMTHLMRLHTEAKTENQKVRTPIIVGHPLVLESKQANSIEIGSMVSKEKMERHFPPNLTKDPFWITDKLVFLGEITRIFDYEGKQVIGKIATEHGEEDDFVHDDTALVYKSAEGLVIMIGCAHSGICNIIEHAKKICGDERIVDVIGGFHLIEPDEPQLQQTVQYFEKLNPASVHACHCTDFRSKVALSHVANVVEVGVGLQIKYD